MVVTLYENRISICQKCDLYNHKTTRCSSCGCFMAIKARIPFTSCPEKKWGKEKQNMAYFAQLDENNTVLQVVVVKDNVIGNAVFPESEQLGIDFCKSLYGEKTVWVQTSPEKSFRKHFAGVGSKYDVALDSFIPYKPYNSWVLNPEELIWEAPIPYPDEYNSYAWDEESLSWKETKTKIN